ncbi:hypothetical protein ACFS27_10540 [Promicromonospora vindobonensis]|uniref:Uncharacterized protein n=1 Tax=Promicromonospora vindobonensis TaxID=195748 RepID=A0ABW5VQK7_9MICO
MSASTTPETEPAPEGYGEFIADLMARVRATQRTLEKAFPDAVVLWPGVEELTEDEIARIES